MASTLPDRLSRLVKTMRGQARITEDNVQEMLREVRMALLEADVALPVVKHFIDSVRAKALDREVIGSLTPGQALVGVVQRELAALAAAIRLLRDVNIIEKFTDVKQDSYSKNRLGQGPTKFYENAKVIKGDKADVDRITNHVLGDACTPGNAKECTFDLVRPVVEHCMNGDLDDLLDDYVENDRGASERRDDGENVAVLLDPFRDPGERFAAHAFAPGGPFAA